MGNERSHTSEAASPSRHLDYSVDQSEAAAVSTDGHGTESASSDHPVIRQLILHRSEKRDDVIFLVKKRSILRFVLAPSLGSLNVRLFVNPQSVGVEKEQDVYELTWHRKHVNQFESFTETVHVFADVHATVAGSFRYFFTINGTRQPEDADGSGYFIVQPELKVGSLKTNVPLHGIVCQTVLSKNLGPFTGWLARLNVAKKTGYNAIHFTPLQVCCYLTTFLFSFSLIKGVFSFIVCDHLFLSVHHVLTANTTEESCEKFYVCKICCMMYN